MKISKQARRDAKQLFNVCKVSGVLDENRVRQTVGAVIEKICCTSEYGMSLNDGSNLKTRYVS